MALRSGATEDKRAALSRTSATSFSLKPVAVLFPHLSTSVAFDTVGKIHESLCSLGVRLGHLTPWHPLPWSSCVSACSSSPNFFSERLQHTLLATFNHRPLQWHMAASPALSSSRPAPVQLYLSSQPETLELGTTLDIFSHPTASSSANPVSVTVRIDPESEHFSAPLSACLAPTFPLASLGSLLNLAAEVGVSAEEETGRWQGWTLLRWGLLCSVAGQGVTSLLAGAPRVWVITTRGDSLQEPGTLSPRASACCFEFTSLSVQSSMVFPRL